MNKSIVKRHSFIKPKALIMFTLWYILSHAEGQLLFNKHEFKAQEHTRNLIMDILSGKASSEVVIEQLSEHTESQLLATVTIMHENYWRDNSIVATVSDRLPYWNDMCPEVYLSVIQNIDLIYNHHPAAFNTMWFALQKEPLLLEDIIAELMYNKTQAEVEKIKKKLLTMEKQKSQQIIKKVALEAVNLNTPALDQKKVLELLKTGGLNQKRIILLSLHARWPQTMDEQLYSCLKGLAENSSVKSIALLADRLLYENVPKEDLTSQPRTSSKSNE